MVLVEILDLLFELHFIVHCYRFFIYVGLKIHKFMTVVCPFSNGSQASSEFLRQRT